MAITPTVRSFYELSTRRVTQLRTLRIQELAPEAIQTVRIGEQDTEIDRYLTEKASLDRRDQSLRSTQIPQVEAQISVLKVRLSGATGVAAEQLRAQIAALEEDLAGLEAELRAVERRREEVNQRLQDLRDSAPPLQLTRQEVLSQENLDPTEYNFILVEAALAVEKTPRVLRVVTQEDVVLDVEEGQEDSIPSPPYSSDFIIGRTGNIVENGLDKPVVVLALSLDTDILIPLLLVEVVDPTVPSDPEEEKRLFIIPIERIAVTVAEKKVSQHLVVESPDGVAALFNVGGKDTQLYLGPKGQIQIAELRNEGMLVSIVPVENSGTARKATFTLPGIIRIDDFTENTLSSAQVGRNGRIVMTSALVTEEIVDPETCEKTVAEVVRPQLAWQPPEAEEAGPPVTVTDTGGEQKLELYSVIEVVPVDPFTGLDGEMFIKEMRLDVTVDLSKFTSELTGEEEISVRTTWTKTPDGRPIFGRFGAQSIAELPTGSFLRSHPGIGLQLTGAGKRFTGVDDRGRFMWYDPDDPIPLGREAATSLFERRVVTKEEGAALGFINLDEVSVVNVEGATDDDIGTHPIWFVPSPTPNLIAVVEETGVLRPYSSDLGSPDFKKWPYTTASARAINKNPERLASDEIQRRIPTMRLSGGHPPYPSASGDNGNPEAEVPFVRSTDEIYYFLVVDEDFMKTSPVLDAGKKIKDALVRNDIGEIVTESRVEAPVGSFTTNTDDIGREEGKWDLQGESIIVITYGRKAGVGASPVDERISQLSNKLSNPCLTDFERADILQELDDLFNGGS